LWARIKIDGHTLITAKTGAGKSKLMELMIFDQQRKSQKSWNKAIVLVDIHGDFAKSCLSFVHNKNPERLVYVSSSINREFPTDDTYSATINPFEIGSGGNKTVEEISVYANELADAISELLETAAHPISVQMSALLKPTIFTLMFSAQNPSLGMLADMFLDKDGRNSSLLALGLQSPVPLFRDFFQHDWHSSEYTLTKRSIRTKLLYFLADPMLSHMINGRSTVNLEQCLNEGKIIIINVPKSAGKFTSSVIARLVVASIHAIMIRRDGIERKLRKPCFLYLDEFQTMATSSLISSLAETRKYSLTIVAATQTTEALSKDVRTAFMVNSRIKMISWLDHAGKMLFSKELNVSMDTLNSIKAMEFVVKISDGKHEAFKFKVPILGKNRFLTGSEQQELYKYLVLQSGQYRKVSFPPAPPLADVSLPAKPVSKQLKKGKDDNPFSDGLKPGF